MSYLLPFFKEVRSAFSDSISSFLSGNDSLPTDTNAGVPVTEQLAMTLTAVYASIKILADTFASLPLHVYEALEPRGNRRAKESPAYRLLHDTPNPELTSYQWRSLTSVHRNLWGAGISEIEFNSTGKPVALWPLPPWRTTPKRLPNKSIIYEVLLDSGEKKYLPSYATLVFPTISTSSFEWQSPIALHRETVGMAMALNAYGALTFGQGTNPSGILYHPGKLAPGSEKSLEEKMKAYRGLSTKHRIMLLDQGMKFERIGLPPEDAQYLQTRKFCIADIARIYSMPLHMLQEHDKSTSFGTGIEEMNIGFVTFTMRPMLVQAEQEINRRLLGDNKAFFAEFNVEGLLRGKLLDRYAAYAIGRQWGFKSANDVRDTENENPIGEQGDKYLTPFNMMDASKEQEPISKDKEEMK